MSRPDGSDGHAVVGAVDTRSRATAHTDSGRHEMEVLPIGRWRKHRTSYGRVGHW